MKDDTGNYTFKFTLNAADKSNFKLTTCSRRNYAWPNLHIRYKAGIDITTGSNANLDMAASL